MRENSIIMIILVALLFILSSVMLEITHAENMEPEVDTINNTSRDDSSINVRNRNTTDTEPPVPQMKTDPANRICHIDKWIILDASISTDNVDEVDTITFKWDLDLTKDTDNDGILNNDVDATGAIVNFTPRYTGIVPIGLNVSDTSGNWANTLNLTPWEWAIDVVGPDLRLAPVNEEINKYIKVSKKKPREGEVVKFTVNITNTNEVTAWDVAVKFYIDGKVKDTKTIKRLDEDAWKQLSFKWKVSGAKKHNITFKVTLANETYEQFWDNNEMWIFIQVPPDGPLPGFEIIAILTAIIIIQILYRRKLK